MEMVQCKNTNNPKYWTVKMFLYELLQIGNFICYIVILPWNRELKSTNNRSVLSFGKTEARVQHALGLFYDFKYSHRWEGL